MKRNEGGLAGLLRAKKAIEVGDPAAGNTVVTPGFKQTDDDKIVSEDEKKRMKRMIK